MFEQDLLHQRGKALEDEFFHRVDEKLGAALRARMDRDDAIEHLKSTTGFDDQAVARDAGILFGYQHMGSTFSTQLY